MGNQQNSQRAQPVEIPTRENLQRDEFGEFDEGAGDQGNQARTSIPGAIPEEKQGEVEQSNQMAAQEQRNINAMQPQVVHSGYGQGSVGSRPIIHQAAMQNQRPAGGYGRAGEQQAPPRHNPYATAHRQSMTLAESLGQDLSQYRRRQYPATGPQGRGHQGIHNWQPQVGASNNNIVGQACEFTRAVSHIFDERAGPQGNSGMGSRASQQMFEQLQMALAIKMGLDGPQLVKQRALQNLLTSETARGDIRQIVRSRAELYGDLLDPK